MSVRISLGDAEPVVVLVKDQLGDPLTGKSDIKAKVWRYIPGTSTLQFLDWSDLTFKDRTLVTTLLQGMSEVDPTGAPGDYRIVIDTSAITNVLDGDTLQVEAEQDGGVDAVGLPVGDEIKVGGWVDQILMRDLVVKQSYSYDAAGDILTGLVWVEWENKVQTGASNCSVGWYDADGSLMFTMTKASPDAQGLFKVTQSAPGLATSRIYYAKPVLTVPGISTSVDGAKAPFTIG